MFFFQLFNGIVCCSSFIPDDSTEEVIDHMKQVVATGPELSMDERNVLSVAYKNKADHLLTVICCHSTWIWYDLIWFVCEWTLMDFGFDVIWLCSSFLTCMRAQTHLQVHRNFVQMQLVLVLMINNLWGFSWLIKLPSQPPCTQRHLATPCSSILIPFYISNVLQLSGWHAAKCLSCH